MEKDNKPPRFYRGELDDRVGIAEHGAVLNDDYKQLMVNGPWGQAKMWNVRDGVHCLTGFAVANFTLIESDNGFILIDTGLNYGCGKALLKRKAEISDKPIVAIIYSHNHYTGGARAIIDASPDREIPIYAHPQVQNNIFGLIDPGTLRHATNRAIKQMGMLLPKSGADASATYGFCIPQFDDRKLNQSGHLAPTHTVDDGEEVFIDGVRVCFHHVIADADDSLISYFPDYDLIQHNTAIMPVMFPLYTLRGGNFRDPRDLIDGINKIREIKPEFMIGCHGNPVFGKDKVYELATLHRDAYAYLFQQTLRGINRGLNPEQLVAQVQFPPHMNDNPALFPAYIDVEYIIRGIYQGAIGWWSTDTADLHPPSPQELDSVIVEGFGGSAALISRAHQALQEHQYNLVAKLMSIVLNVEPNNREAKQLKADVLRQMGQTTRSGIQTRNFLLHEALELEGKITPLDSGSNPALVNLSLVNLSLATILDSPPATTLRLLENHFDPSGIELLTATVIFHFTDLNQRYGLVIRQGAVEFLSAVPEHNDMEIQLDYAVWANIAVGITTLQAALDKGVALVSGEKPLIDAVLGAYKGILSH